MTCVVQVRTATAKRQRQQSMAYAPLEFRYRKPRRMSMTVPDSAYQELIALSNQQGRSMSNLAAFLLEGALEHYRREGRRDSNEPV